jgi:AcrR family transcriptional regulator
MRTERPLRQDAVRNRERLVAAARDAFRRKGLDASLEEIARAAGVAIGTLYNRFPSRGELVDAALGPVAQRAVELAEGAATAEDPWLGLVSLIEGTCALFADERGYADVYRSRVPGTPVITAARERLGALKTTVMTRAKRAGVLRDDVEGTDLTLITWRPEAAHPLPAPMTRQQIRDTPPPR